MTAGRKPPTRRNHSGYSVAELDARIEEAIVDAYGDDEQRGGMITMIEEHLALPFETVVLGLPVTVEKVDLTTAGEIVAICRRGRARQAIPILELPMPDPPPKGVEWIAAYRRWSRGH